MRERIARNLDRFAFFVMGLSDRVQDVDSVVALYDDEPFPTEVDNEDPRNFGESPQ